MIEQGSIGGAEAWEMFQARKPRVRKRPTYTVVGTTTAGLLPAMSTHYLVPISASMLGGVISRQMVWRDDDAFREPPKRAYGQGMTRPRGWHKVGPFSGYRVKGAS